MARLGDVRPAIEPGQAVHCSLVAQRVQAIAQFGRRRKAATRSWAQGHPSAMRRVVHRAERTSRPSRVEQAVAESFWFGVSQSPSRQKPRKAARGRRR